jgi:hypothetical protein
MFASRFTSCGFVLRAQQDEPADGSSHWAEATFAETLAGSSRNKNPVQFRGRWLPPLWPPSGSSPE